MLSTYQLSVLYEIVRSLHVFHSPEKVYTYLVEQLSDAIKAESASVFEVDSASKKLVLRACFGPKKAELENAIHKLDLPLGKGLAGWAAMYNQPSIVNDVRLTSRFNPAIDEAIGYKTRNTLCVPIANKDKVLGVVEFLNRQSGHFSKDEQELVMQAAKQAAVAVENSKLFAELEESRHFTDSMLSNLSGGLIAVNNQELITHFNPAAERILQMTAAEVIGKKYEETLKDYPPILKEIMLAVSARERKLRQELYCSGRKDKKSMKIGYSTFLVQDKQSEFLGAGLIFQHIE